MSFISNYSFKSTLKKTVGVFSVLFAFLLSAQANVVCMCVTTPVTLLEVIDGDSIWVKKEGGEGPFLHGVTNLSSTIIDREGPIHVEY